jgi:hypothetical protein
MNFDQIVEDLFSNLHPDSVTWLQEHTEDEARGLHHSLGMGIRNEYGLWDQTHPLTGNYLTKPETRDVRDGVDWSKDHPDSVSNEIIAAIWHKANTPTQVK